MKSRFAILALGALLLAWGCRTQGNTLWIEPGSTARNLVFGFGQSYQGPPVDQFGVFRVYACDGESVGPGAMWVLSQTGPAPAAARVKYGEPPAGYISDQGPVPLHPGCYRAYATTGGQVAFTILEDGSVTVDSASQEGGKPGRAR